MTLGADGGTAGVMSIALTQTVQKGGCAAKIAATELRRILSRVTFPKPHPELLVDAGLFDDAAVYRVSEDLALVQTLDFFTPILDTPRLFGAVAAANALSDVFAMGGRPKTAMGILAFPLATMDADVIVDVMQGASDKIAEAGANFVGGHSIDDDTLKFGLSVTGFVHPGRTWTNAGARAGDALMMTKALGTGTMTAGLKRRELTEAEIDEAIQSMALVNNVIDYLTPDLQGAVHAATDVTGFGLSGHAAQLARASAVTLEFEAARMPAFARARECLERGFLTKAHRSNAAYVGERFAPGPLDEMGRLLMHDPQTSGGLLLSVDAGHADGILAALKPNFPRVAHVGRVRGPGDHEVRFV